MGGYMKFYALFSLLLALVSAGESAVAKTYVYTCTTAVIDRWGREAPGTRYEAYYRAGDGDRVGILSYNFCPDALNACVNSRAQWDECCEVVGAGALGGDYTRQVRITMGRNARVCRNSGGTGWPPPPGGGHGVHLYSGYCTQANFIAAVGPTTDCSYLQNSPWVRAVELNGRCQGTHVMSAVEACERYKYH